MGAAGVQTAATAPETDPRGPNRGRWCQGQRIMSLAINRWLRRRQQAKTESAAVSYSNLDAYLPHSAFLGRVGPDRTDLCVLVYGGGVFAGHAQRRLRVRVDTVLRPRTVIGTGLRDRRRERPRCPVFGSDVRIFKRGPPARYTVIRHSSSRQMSVLGQIGPIGKAQRQPCVGLDIPAQ